MKKALTKTKVKFPIYYYQNNIRKEGVHSRIKGNVSGIWGDVSGIRGDVSGIRGDVSEVHGDMNLCEITEKEKKEGIKIDKLIKDSTE